MNTTIIKKKIAASEWFETAKQNKIITYQELADLIQPEWIDLKNTTMIIDFMEKNGISVVTSRQKSIIIQSVEKKQKKAQAEQIALTGYDKNDPLTLFLRAYNGLTELSDDHKNRLLQEIRSDEIKIENYLFQSLYSLYYLMSFPPETLNNDRLGEFLLSFDANEFKALLIYEKQINYYRSWHETIWNKWKTAMEAMKTQQLTEADQIITEIIQAVIQLKWKKEICRRMIMTFINEKSFDLIPSTQEDEWVHFRVRLTEYQKICQDLVAQILQKKDELVKSHMKLVLSIAKSYTGKGIDFMDLIQEGNRGLIDAINQYESRFNLPFRKYVTRHIRKTIISYLASNFNSLVLSKQKMELLKKIRKIQNRLAQELEREPSMEEVSAKACLPIGMVTDLLQLLKRETSWDGMVNLNRTEFRHIHATDYENKEIEKINQRLSNAKLSASLTDREEQILKLKYGFNGMNYNDEEIGKIFDLDLEQVRLIEKNAYEKLKKEIKLLEIKGFVVFP